MRSVLMTTLIAGTIIFGGCAQSAKDIVETRVDPACAQRCSILHSRCASEMNMMSSPMMSKCNDAYDSCMGACPSK
jgi:hypothetical protein